jgi:putative transposase
MTRHSALRVLQGAAALRPRMQPRQAAPPLWGDRRIGAYWRVVEQPSVNQKRVRRVRREPQLLVPPHLRLNAQRTPTRSQPRPTTPNAWWGLDMTKVLVEGFGGVSSVVVLAWETNAVVGDSADWQGTTPPWRAALERALQRQCPAGAPGKGLSLRRDHGGQPTSVACMRACRALGLHQAFTSDNTPQGKADTARVRRTLKAACLWRHEWTSPVTVARALKPGLDQDNEQYLPSALG